MTEKAITLLQGNPKGFVLQVEGASIDKRDHSADACGQIGELLGMDDAIGVAQEFQRTHPDTLILVTRRSLAHEPDHPGHARSPRGAYTTLQTVDGQPIRIAYGTAPVAGSQAHTGSTVPVFASGPRAADIVGTIDQTELFPVLTNTADRRRPGDRAARVGGDVGGAVPATLALTVGAAGDVRPFRPGRREGLHRLAGRQRDLLGGRRDAQRSPTRAPIATGHLVNGAFSLAKPLAGQGAQRRVRAGRRQRRADDAARPGPARSSNAAVPVDFKQSIGANEALRTGTYAKTLTLTLSTTAP